MTREETRSAPQPRILLGSTNPAKIERLRDCLDGWPFTLVTVDELPGRDEPPEEAGGTHREIAEAKARDWARICGGLAIASDGGVEIPALGSGWDSLFTRRAAGQDATDDDRIRHLVALMNHLQTDSERAATWHEAVSIAEPTGVVVQTWEVTGPTGVIGHHPSEQRIDGFWLASLWHFPSLGGKTYTELSAEELSTIGDPWLRLKTEIHQWLSKDGGEKLNMEMP